jgi:hypothetical protein
MITYTVQADGTAWKIVQGSLTYPGYRSEASATKAAISVASKVGHTGEATFVEVAKADGSLERIFASDPEPPTLDSMMRMAGHIGA